MVSFVIEVAHSWLACGPIDLGEVGLREEEQRLVTPILFVILILLSNYL